MSDNLSQYSFYAWLGVWRDKLPPQAVEQLQTLIEAELAKPTSSSLSQIARTADAVCDQIVHTLKERLGYLQEQSGVRWTGQGEECERQIAMFTGEKERGNLVATIIESTLRNNDHDLREVIEDRQRLVRELDVIWNGVNAASQASLCDLVAQIENELPELRDLYRSGVEDRSRCCGASFTSVGSASDQYQCNSCKELLDPSTDIIYSKPPSEFTRGYERAREDAAKVTEEYEDLEPWYDTHASEAGEAKAIAKSIRSLLPKPENDSKSEATGNEPV